MKKLMAVLVGFLLYQTSILSYANTENSLTLSPLEMQKLKKYFPNEDSEHTVWKGDPLKIALPVGKEKRIIFTEHVTVDIKNALATDQLRILNDDKSIYLTALKPFETTRIFVTLQDSGKVLLIDLLTDDNASSATQQIDIKIIKPKVLSNQDNEKFFHSVDTVSTSDTMSQDPDLMSNSSYVDLIRFAWQQVYAPKRLLPKEHFSRTPMHADKFISDLVYGDKVIAYPEASWFSNGHYVTAVLLRNKYPVNTSINIKKDLCGDWQAASIYPRSNLTSIHDQSRDSTMLFVVSTSPFGEVIGVCHGNA